MITRHTTRAADPVVAKRSPLSLYGDTYKFGWLQGPRKLLKEKKFWLRGQI
jgi:hypothetical protein